jgi:polyhydroxyalkanoate synthesis regulator phasin
MSKRKTIYKPKKGKRISQKKLYKLPKQQGKNMKGGGVWDDFKGIFTGGKDPMDGSPMDVSTEEQEGSPMDVSPEDNETKVDSEENASGLATKVSEVGSLIGDSAKGVAGEFVDSVSKPSEEVDENISTDVTDESDESDESDNVEELKKQIALLKEENNQLKDKLIVKLENENETLKHQDSTDISSEEHESSPMDISSEEHESSPMDISSSAPLEMNSHESMDTIDLESTPEGKSQENPAFGNQISPIDKEPTPTGGKKRKNKKQRTTRRKKH